MADHTRHILRNWRVKRSTTAFIQVASENALSFFGTGDHIPQAEKYAFYGNLWITVALGSTGGGGYRLPIAGYRTPGAATVNVSTGGTQENVGISGGLVSASGGANFTIDAGGQFDGYTSILNITLDIFVTGGTGPIV